ncbi:hypothetical protein UNDYM_4017 [Undibacterium sp. YM2]|uniref:DUF262 domain-containing protein n=1 Tax=Undibacterium sp. YM2 TaxID=2058625 RepID=UPI001331C734|nr:DUF262 domain-containing protein [Undibacterium sp. YM2]BBB68270.1 hypothetical protein UNDYM_4017 [Undibacterium sp. YM2]
MVLLERKNEDQNLKRKHRDVNDTSRGNPPPPIQRSFVWNKERILKLFDSLYRDYPLGNCIFWNVSPATSKYYQLYRFARNFSENKREKTGDGLASVNLLENNVFAVVDGQQRLSSLFIGLVGTYRYKKSGKGLRNVSTSFVDSNLHLNLFAQSVKDQDESIFQFLGSDSAKTLTDKSLWFEVGLALKWQKISSVRDYVAGPLTTRVKQQNKKIVTTQFFNRTESIIAQLESIWRMLHEKRLFYFDIDNQNLDEVVEMFTRINSGGMTLKKSDLLFSVLVSQWSEGRNEILGLVNSMQESGLDISQDFVMRACLMLTDSPIKYNLGAFKIGNVEKIKNSWEEIKTSLMNLCELLPEIGYINHPNLSENALIPIAYYIMKKGVTKTNSSRKTLQRYYVISQINSIFSGQNDQVLERFRTEINKQLKVGRTLDFQGLLNMKLPGQRSMSLDLESLQELVDETSYGSPHAYFLLSLIYPTVDFKVHRYEVDHIHPKSKFNSNNLKNHGITDPEKIQEWLDWKRDALPNLELLARDNQYKGATPLVDYLKTKKMADRRQFCALNLLPKPGHRDLELSNFDSFYEGRKKRLISKLKPHFGL